MHSFSSKKTTSLLFFVLIVGAALRFSHIGFGLPYFINPNEGHYLPKAIRMLRDLNFNPKYFHNPPFLTYIYAFSVCVFFVLWKVLGLFVFLPDFTEFWKSDPTSFYVLARCISAGFGVCTSLLLYQIGKKLFDAKVGIISCAMLSFCFLHVRDSHYAVNDVASTFFLVWAFKYIVDLWLEGRTRSFVFSGIISGLAVATKYNTGVIVVPFIVAYFLRYPCMGIKGVRKMLIYFLCCFIGFCIGCPWIILDVKEFIAGFGAQLLFAKQPWFGGSDENAWVQFLRVLLWGYGILPLLFAVIGSVRLTKKKELLLIIMAFPVVYYFLMGLSKLFFVRFVIPMLPFLSMVSAVGIVGVADYFSGHRKNQVMVLLTLLTLSQGFIFSLKHNAYIGKDDTRITARNWIRKNVPAGSKIIMEGCCPNLRDMIKDEGLRSYKANTVWKQLPKKTLRDYDNEDYGFIITSDFIRLQYEDDKKKYAKEIEFYSSLDEGAEKIYQSDVCRQEVPFNSAEIIKMFWNLDPGPCIRVYKIKDRT